MNAHLVIAVLAGERIAFASDEIESVVEIGAILPVPRAAPHVAGLAALRSRVLTVIDCRASLQPGSCVERPRDALVAVHDGHAFALLVDRVEDAVEADGAICDPPAGLSPEWARVVRGHVFAEERMLLLADLPALIAGPANSTLNHTLTLGRYDAVAVQGASRT